MERVQKLNQNTINKQRNTNLELFRIIAMLGIIAGHYVVNSGLYQCITEDPLSVRSMLLLIFGAWGKTGINCFVLITGYFMCQSTLTAKKYFKLLLEVIFYRFAVNAIFWITGYQQLNFETLFRLVPISKIADGFTPTYLVFMLTIPFINVLVKNLTQKQHAYLMLLMSYIYIFFETFKPIFTVKMNYVSWFFVLYLFASYVRLYPCKLFESTKFWGRAMLVCLGISITSVVAGQWAATTFLHRNGGLYFLTDSNALLAFATGFSSFMFFKNVKIPYNRFINAVASTCFGVLLIHANSDTMRQWLWKDVLNNVGAFDKAWLPLHAISSVLMVFTIGAAIDYLRILFLEKPLFKIWDKHWPKVVEKYKKKEEKLLKKLGIPQ